MLEGFGERVRARERGLWFREGRCSGDIDLLSLDLPEVVVMRLSWGPGSRS